MNSNMIHRREEIKLALGAENTRTIVDVYLRWLMRGKIVPIWLDIILIFLLSAVVALTLAFLTGELGKIPLAARDLPPGMVVQLIFTLFMSTVSMLLTNLFFHRVVAVLREQVVDLAETPETLDELLAWVKLNSYKGWPRFLVILAAALGVASYLVTLSNRVWSTSFGIGMVFALTPFSIQSIIFIGFTLGVLGLSLRLERFDLKLFEANPSSSEIIATLSGLFRGYVYLIAIYGAIQTFRATETGLVPYLIPIMTAFWVPIIAIFIASQIGLAGLIRGAKWKTLRLIQEKVSTLQKEHPMPASEERETIIWWLDYHERVRSTPNSALDLGSWLNFINSLLLPLIAFILGNLDTLMQFFSGKP